MTTLPFDAPRWSTSSINPGPRPSSVELALLGDHLRRCRVARGRWFGLQCVAETLDHFLASRFVTTVLAAGLLIGAASML